MKLNAALLAVSLCVAVSPALAQTKTIGQELPAEARTNWKNANEFYDAQNWPAAVAEFQRAYDLSKNPRVLFNVAVCEKNMGHYLRASKIFRQELSEGGKKLPASEAAAIKSALTLLEPLISTALVLANEDGATLTIDKEEVGTTPFTSPIPIDAGVHTMKLSKPGFRDEVKENVTVVSGDVARVTFRLEPLERKAEVTVEVAGPPKAEVWIDGKDVGTAPFAGQVDEGPHVFEARADDWVTVREARKLAYKDKLGLALAMTRKRHEGTLAVNVLPVGATIELDGQRVGETRWEGALSSEKSHTLVVRKSGFYSVTQEVSVADDQSRSLPVSLNPEKTWIWWTLGAVAVVGASVAVGYFALHSNSPDPVRGTLDAGDRGWGTTSLPLPGGLR